MPNKSNVFGKGGVWAVAIVLGDNDFGDTMRNLLLTTCKVLLHWHGEDVASDMRRIGDVIRAGVEYHYVAFQNLRCPTAQSPEDTADYLRKKMKVFFNDEAFAKLSTEDHDHGAWYVDVPRMHVVSF